MITMDDTSQTSILQRWKREQEELRQYHILRRRRYLQTDRQHQRQRLVMAAMEQHERRRKRIQRALDHQRRLTGDHHHQQQQQQQQQPSTRRMEHHGKLRNHHQHEEDEAATAAQSIVVGDRKKDQDIHDPMTTKVNKLATLTTIKHQLANYMEHWMNFLDDDQKHLQPQHLDTYHHKFTATRWTHFKRLVLLLVYEDTLMRLLLRLDAISSDGDHGIRQQRKALVKRTNGFLDQLDQYKQLYVGGNGG